MKDSFNVRGFKFGYVIFKSKKSSDISEGAFSVYLYNNLFC